MASVKQQTVAFAIDRGFGQHEPARYSVNPEAFRAMLRGLNNADG
jgi:hypothetical protein